MKSYLIVEEHNTKTLKIIPYSEYLLNADNVFLYEVISDADTEVFPKQKDIKKQPMFTCLQTKEYCY